ncbi:class I SAM-dependent methyltransferase [bacterium]|nr:MAG: class I SAM-dependent methyltransferase [bacterium]
MSARFEGEDAGAYGRRARRLIPDYDGLHEVVAATLSGVSSLLSAGCGDGEELARTSSGRKVGIDPSPDMIALARRRLDASVELSVGTAADLSETYGAVAAILVGHFVPYPDRDAFYLSLRERCEGRLVIAEMIAPVDADLWGEWMIGNGTEDGKARSAVAKAMAELYPLERNGLVAKVEQAGFQLESELWSASPFAAFSFFSR